MRNYIGASAIGDACFRRIWYGFKGYIAEFDNPITTRRFDIGRALENVVIDWFIDEGFFVELTKEAFVCSEFAFIKGHVDGFFLDCGGNREAVIEIKTANDESFKQFLKLGVKLWRPSYFSQAQMYMGLTNVHTLSFWVLNKNSAELIEEIIYFDEEEYKRLIEIARLIELSPVHPPRIGSKGVFPCTACGYKGVCFDE